MANLKLNGRGANVFLSDFFFATDFIITKSEDLIFSINEDGSFLEFIGKFILDESGDIISGDIKKINVHNPGYSYSVTTKINYNDLIAMSGSDFGDIIFAGNDIINGTIGDDFVIISGAGKDKVSLGAGRDFFSGVEGATIDLGSGNDFVTLSDFSNVKLGSGSDIVQINIDFDKENKTIKDFSFSEDIIEIEQVSFSNEQLQNFYWDGSSNYLELFQSQVRVGENSHLFLSSDQFLAYDTKTGKIYFDEDGGRQGLDPVLIATLANKPKLTAEMLADDIVVLSGILSDYTGLFGEFILTQQ